jgi:hypothetical protein
VGTIDDMGDEDMVGGQGKGMNAEEKKGSEV